MHEDSIICESDDDLLNTKKCVPTLTQIREQLGGKLSDVFFESLTDEAKAWVGNCYYC